MKHLKIFENYTSFNNKDLIIVDIQPEYEGGFNFDTTDFIYFLNDNYEMFNSITILYNGVDTLGMINKHDYISWFIENGLEEDVLEYIDFYDKGYAFFRFCIDSSIDDEITVNIIKYMIINNINDTRDINSDMWDELIVYFKEKDVDMDDVRVLLEHSLDMINIPDLMDELKYIPSDNILLTGGHIEECLREVVLVLKVLDKKYEILEEFIY